jgi:2,3,4,5-tetrahydropyridine-2-carboxylate N-succinyltransferase
METVEAGIFEYHDKMLKRDYAEKKGTCSSWCNCRYGAYISSGVIMMPSYVTLVLM